MNKDKRKFIIARCYECGNKFEMTIFNLRVTPLMRQKLVCFRCSCRGGEGKLREIAKRVRVKVSDLHNFVYGNLTGGSFSGRTGT